MSPRADGLMRAMRCTRTLQLKEIETQISQIIAEDQFRSAFSAESAFDDSFFVSTLRICGSSSSTISSVAQAMAYGRMWLASLTKAKLPTNGPRMRASEAQHWFTA